MGSQGYNGLPAYYAQSSDPTTPNVGFALKGMDPIIAENFVLADAAIGTGGGSSVKVNGSVITNPNFNGTTPAAPSGKTLVTWQFDGSGNVSAYITTPSGGSPGGPNHSIQYKVNSTTFGGLASFVLNPSNGEVSITDTAAAPTGLATLSVFGNLQSDNLQDWYLQGSTAGTPDVWLDGGAGLNWAADAIIAAGTASQFILVADGNNVLQVSGSGTGQVVTLQNQNDTDVSLNGADGSLHLDSSGITYMGADGGVLLGVSTPGGAQGSGTINAQGLFVNGVAVGFGTVTSVAMTGDGVIFNSTVGGSPITSSGTLIPALLTQTANRVLAGPTSGIAATPTFRALVTADLPAGTGTVTSVAMTGDGVIFNSTVGGSPITASGTLTPALLTQTANFVLAGPTSGSAAAPTFRALVAADIPSGTVPWNNIGNATGNLTLANGANTTEFDQTANTIWLWKNTTIATVATTNASPLLELAANYWTGAASAADTWSIGTSLLAGTNGISALTIAHTGSSGLAYVAAPYFSPTSAGTPVLTTRTFIGNFANNANLTAFGNATSTFVFGVYNLNATLYQWGVQGGATPSVNVSNGSIRGWSSTTASNGGNDVGFSRISAGLLGLGNGTTAGDFTGSLTMNNLTQNNNTIATVSTTNATPSHVFSANYWTGAASAADTWTIGAALAAGTNGASTLTIGHAGSTGNAVVVIPTTNSATVPSLGFSGNPGVGLGNQGTTLNFISTAATASFNFCNSAGAGFTISKLSGSFVELTTLGANQLIIQGNISTAVTTPSIVLGQNNNNFTGTGAGTQVAIGIGAANGPVTFAPTSGSTNFTALQIAPTINQTGGANGTCTDILVNTTETALVGTHNFLDLQVAGASKFTVKNSGVITEYNAESTAGVGSAYIRGVTKLKAETGADATLLSVTPAAATGVYRISVVLSVSAASAATLGWTATWTDGNGHAQAPTNLALNTAGSAVIATTVTAAANATYYGEWYIDVNNAGTAIVIKTTFSGTSIAYIASATIERVQ